MEFENIIIFLAKCESVNVSVDHHFYFCTCTRIVNYNVNHEISCSSMYSECTVNTKMNIQYSPENDKIDSKVRKVAWPNYKVI